MKLTEKGANKILNELEETEKYGAVFEPDGIEFEPDDFEKVVVLDATDARILSRFASQLVIAWTVSSAGEILKEIIEEIDKQVKRPENKE